LAQYAPKSAHQQISTFIHLNHLAHCLLSFGDEDVLTGNFIGDYIKGNRWQEYAPGLQRGLLLHRAIDAFTDNHPMTDRSVDRLRPFAGRYTPPVVDILYDHLLSLHWQEHVPEGLFPEENPAKVSLDVFAEKTYRMLQNRVSDMPAPMQERLPRMLAGRFLHTYSTREGMDWVMDWFSRRLPANFDPQATLSFFFDHIDDFSGDFNAFFPELKAHCQEYLSK
jgi:acyl carrier protein phosphodiesterase